MLPRGPPNGGLPCFVLVCTPKSRFAAHAPNPSNAVRLCAEFPFVDFDWALNYQSHEMLLSRCRPLHERIGASNTTSRFTQGEI